MAIYDRYNPIDGLSASQIVLLFERGSGHTLNEKLREVAINVVSLHQQMVECPTLQSTMNSILQQSELEEFAAISAQQFLGENFNFDSKSSDFTQPLIMGGYDIPFISGHKKPR